MAKRVKKESVKPVIIEPEMVEPMVEVIEPDINVVEPEIKEEPMVIESIAEIMESIIEPEVNVGLCPCGSGKSPYDCCIVKYNRI